MKLFNYSNFNAQKKRSYASTEQSIFKDYTPEIRKNSEDVQTISQFLLMALMFNIKPFN